MKTDMAHLDVTLGDVIEAANTLQNDRQQVTIEAVRALIGAGSTKTIHQHLATWRASHAQPVETPKAEMPPELLAELSRWAQQYAQDAGAGMRDALARAESDMDALLDAGNALEAERDGLDAELSDALVGKAKDLLAIDGKDAQLADLRQQLERNVAATAAESDARLRAQMELVGVTTERDNLAAEVKELRTMLDNSRSERSNLRAELEALRARK